jgi:hypothetical protein
MSPKQMPPVQYEIVFADDQCYRKEHVTVMAMDAEDALQIASTRSRQFGVKEMERKAPRWMQSDAANCPEIISEGALRFYADKLGFDLVKR